MQENPRINQ